MPPCLQDRPAIPPVSCFHPGPVTDQGARLKIRTRFSHSSGSMFQRALTTKDTPEGAVQSESNTTSDDDDDDKEQTMQANVARQRLFCIECGSGFQSGKDLADHVRVHHTASSGHQSVSLHVCTTCSKAFQRSGDLKKHNRFHTGERPFQCTICTKSFHQSGHLYGRRHRPLASNPVCMTVPSQEEPYPHPYERAAVRLPRLQTWVSSGTVKVGVGGRRHL